MELHHTAVKEEAGFSAVEILLSLIAITLITFVGFYVYHTQQAANATYSAASKSAQITVAHPKKSVETVQEVGTLYEAPSGKYSIKLQDGWKFTRYQESDLIVSNNNNNLKPIAGQKADVLQVEGGKDGSAEGLAINFVTDESGYSLAEYKLVDTTKTNSGLTVKTYKYTQMSDVFAMGALDKGGTYYRFVVTKLGTTGAVHVDYGVNTGQTDYSTDVLTAVKTITLK